MKAVEYKNHIDQSNPRQYKEPEKNNMCVTDLKSTPENKTKSYGAVLKSKKKDFFKWADNRVNNLHKTSVGKVTFQKCMTLTLFLGQCVGLNPVSGIFWDNGSKLRFNYKSWRMLYCSVLCTGQGIATCLSIYKIYRTGVTLALIGYVSFYGTTFVTTLLFLRIAARWPAFVRQVEESELNDLQNDHRLRFRMDTAAITVLTLAVLEHILSLVARFAEITDCYPEKKDVYRAYIEGTFPYLFELKWFSYYLPLGIVLQLINISMTLNWNYSDLFIIGVSFYLTSRIEQVNIKLKAAYGKYLPASLWCTFRKEYNQVTRLVRKFDEVISGLVFASFASNLFFICLQLYNTLRNGIKHGLSVSQCPNFPSGPLGGYEHAVYFMFSLMFLMLRSLTVSLIAARVHSALLVPATTLYAVPSPVYCVEVQRFLDQLHGDKVALTGMRFFNVTRELVLSVAGTIVTYELVLLQFDSGS